MKRKKMKIIIKHSENKVDLDKINKIIANKIVDDLQA